MKGNDVEGVERKGNKNNSIMLRVVDRNLPIEMVVTAGKPLKPFTDEKEVRLKAMMLKGVERKG